MLRTIITLLAVAACAGASAQHDGEDQSIVVQAASFSDSTMAAATGMECAVFLRYLQDVEKYQLKSTTGVQGPPGVVYTLENNKSEVAIVKCGRGGGCSGEH